MACRRFSAGERGDCLHVAGVQGFHNLRSKLLYALYIHIAQLDRAFGYEPKGRGFKSLCGYGNTAYVVLRYGSVVELADTLDLGSSAR